MPNKHQKHEPDQNLQGSFTDYDPNEFRVFAKDESGHSERVWARLQPRHDRQLGIILSSRTWPYRAKGDIIRHAIKRHLDWLDTLAPLPSVHRAVDAIMEVLRDEEMHQDFDMIFVKLGERVSKYIAKADTNAAIGLINRVRFRIEQMPDGPWRDSYLEELQSRWAHLQGTSTSRLPRGAK